IRNEFNHCMYTVNARGDITHTHSIRIVETRKQLQFGDVKPMDDARMKEMIETIQGLKSLNREIWDFLPKLEQHLNRTNGDPSSSSAADDTSTERKQKKSNNQKQ
ncbi:MAG TPA: hypothetical protein VNZ93_16745, partial [Pseudorhodoplanes sp.]|nr:hypothetical protein [Pseudorhodoplanes sp.]